MGKLALDCSQCGAGLEIRDNTQVLRCPHLWVPFLVERSHGAIRLRLPQQARALKDKERQIRRSSAVVEEISLASETRQKRGRSVGGESGAGYSFPCLLLPLVR